MEGPSRINPDRSRFVPQGESEKSALSSYKHFLWINLGAI
jgi:hypothetical protein